MTARSPWWLSLSLLAACGHTNEPPPPQPPTVSVSPILREIIGTGFDLVVEVTGCTKVTKVWATDRDEQHLLAELDGGDTSNHLTVPSNSISYKDRGIPAGLAIFAHATCDTGLTGDADEQGTTFMPASEVLAGPWPFGPNFWVDKDAKSLLTCNVNKDQSMSRLGKDKSSLGGFAMPFSCSADSTLTFGADGARYLMEPGVGVVGFTADMQLTMSFTDFEVYDLAVPQTVSLPVVVLGKDGVVWQLRGYDRKTGAQVWLGDDTAGSPAGAIVVNNTLGEAFYPNYSQETGSDYVDIGIEVYDLKLGHVVDTRTFGKIKVDPISVTPLPTISFDLGADRAYLAEISDPSRVWCCKASEQGGCANSQPSPGLIWKSPQLAGGVLAATRTPVALVAYGDRVAYFLDPTTGAAITPTSTPIHPQGSLVYTAVVSGADGSTYLLSQARDGNGHITSGIKEIQIFDKPNQQVSDFMTGTDGFVMDFDVNGRAWLLKYDLTPLMLPADYRQALGH